MGLTGRIVHAIVYVTVGLFAKAVCHENSNVTHVIDEHKCCKEGLKPAPVQNFTVDIKKHGCMAWNWNFQDPSKDYACALTINSKCTETQTKTVLYSAKTGELSFPGMCRLNPFTEYSLRVKCRFMVNSSVTGYWSDEISILKLLNPDVPYKSPLTVAGLFETRHSNGKISVTVYFTPLNRCELHDSPKDVVYIVKWHGRTMNVSHPSFSAVIDIPDDPLVTVTIQAANSIGPSKNSSGLTIFLHQNETQSSSKLSVETNNTSDNCSVMADLIYRLKVEHPRKDINLSLWAPIQLKKKEYIIVWCRSIRNSCITPVGWVHAEAKTTVKLPIKDCKNHFRFGLITHGFDENRAQCVSSGIRWLNSTPQTQLEDSNRGHILYWKLPLTIGIVAVILVCSIVFGIRRLLRKVPSSMDGNESGRSSPGDSSIVTLDCTETDNLLGGSKRKDNKNNKVDITWMICIRQKSESFAEQLLIKNILPTDNELQHICSLFGRRSKLMKTVCAKICEQVKRKDGNITDIRPAYKSSSGRIAFVAQSEGELSKYPVTDFEIILVRCTNDMSKESEKVLSREMEIDYSKYDIDKLKQLKQCISKNAKGLMDKHQNINVMSPSAVKSVDYNSSEQHKLLETLCISIYIDKKFRGVIPLEEDEIPVDIDGFPTDVIEGRYNVFGDGPNDYQKNLKIGCGIHAGVADDKGNLLGGTLGGFLEHEKYGTCCITCAHVVLPLADMQEVKKHGYLEYSIDTGRSVYQPASTESAEFGKVMAVAYREGEAGIPGVEVALIKVLKRNPITGSFPRGNGDSDWSTTFVFNSGNVSTDYLRPMTNVFKYGMATGPTFGYIGLQGSAVRGCTQLDDPMFGVRLCDQIEIFPLRGSRFANFGDSGACVLMKFDKSGQETAIGVVEGGLDNGKVFVSPIDDVLCALKCKPLLKRFESSFDSGVSCNFPQGSTGEEDMDCS